MYVYQCAYIYCMFFFFLKKVISLKFKGVVTKMLACGILLSEFERLSRITFTSGLIPWGKLLTTLSPPPAVGCIVPLEFFAKDEFGIK